MATEEINLYDRLAGTCADSSAYPTKLFRTQLLPHRLRSYNDLLQQRMESVFTPQPIYPMKFWDCFSGNDGNQMQHPRGLVAPADLLEEFTLPASPCDSFDKLWAHLLQVNRKDPKCRHVFIQADNSRSPLDCSKEMICCLLGFHQVMPQFLEVVLSFGTPPRRTVPMAYQNAVFRYEHSIDSGDAVRSSIPELGRSGRVIQNCYNLWSVEKSDDPKSISPWAIRQTGVYHSFDIDNGRSLWINVKVNALIEERIIEATRGILGLTPNALRNVTDSFKAALTTRLITLEWCCEGWQQYIAHWEADLEKSLCKIKFAPMAKIEAAITNAKTMVASTIEPPLVRPSRQSTVALNSRSSTCATTSRPVPNRSGTGLTSLTTKLETMADAQGPNSKSASTPNTAVKSPTVNPFENFDFKLGDMQHLHHIGSNFQEARMVMKLNIDILTEITEYYRTYLEDSQMPETIRLECRDELLAVLQRTASIVRELETQRRRISTLLVMVEDGKLLLDAIVQFRNMELNQLSTFKMETMTKNMQDITKEMHFSTLQMEESTVHMEQIAEKTKKETSSMHVITLVTLVFLPPTFISTFLGSGVFQWEGGVTEGQEGPSMPVWKPEYFTMFARISFPLMGTIILVWLGATIWRPKIAQAFSKTRSWIRREKSRADEETCASQKMITDN